MGGVLLAFVLGLGFDSLLLPPSSFAVAKLPSSWAPSGPSDVPLLALFAGDPSAADAAVGDAEEGTATAEAPVRSRAKDEPARKEPDRPSIIFGVIMFAAIVLPASVWVLTSTYTSWRRFRMERDRHELTMRHAQEQHEAKMAYSRELLRGMQRNNRQEPWQEEP